LVRFNSTTARGDRPGHASVVVVIYRPNAAPFSLATGAGLYPCGLVL